MALPIGSEPRRGIPTKYAGTRFRSRLEARWAAFFDLIGWSWVYEPFDTDHWIPDFLIRGTGDLGRGEFLVEVGPCSQWSDYHAEKALTAFPEEVDRATGAVVPAEYQTLVVGTYPSVDIPGPANAYPWQAIGLLTSDGAGAGTAPAILGRCDVCGEVCITHFQGVYIHLPCAHWSDNTGDLIPETSVRETWNRASTPTQWLGIRR